MVQLTFDMIEIDSPQYIETKEEIIKGDRVRIIKDNLDYEALNYFEYYYPVALKSSGDVIRVCTESKNDYLKVLYDNGDIILIEKKNVKKED